MHNSAALWGWFSSVSYNCREHVKAVNIIKYFYVYAVNNDYLHTENKDKYSYGLFRIGENDLRPFYTLYNTCTAGYNKDIIDNALKASFYIIFLVYSTSVK